MDASQERARLALKSGISVMASSWAALDACCRSAWASIEREIRLSEVIRNLADQCRIR